jgi:hypothetical protein
MDYSSMIDAVDAYLAQGELVRYWREVAGDSWESGHRNLKLEDEVRRYRRELLQLKRDAVCALGVAARASGESFGLLTVQDAIIRDADPAAIVALWRPVKARYQCSP